MRSLRWIAVCCSGLGFATVGRAGESAPPPLNVAPPIIRGEVLEGPALYRADFAVAETHCLQNVLARMRLAPMPCIRLANPSKYPPVVAVLDLRVPTKSAITRVQYQEMPKSNPVAVVNPPVYANSKPAFTSKIVAVSAVPAKRLSLFGLSRIHTATPSCGELQPCPKPSLGILKSHAEKASCDPFKNKKPTCATCTDRSYLERERPLIEKANCRDLRNEPRAYRLLAGSPRCDVTIKDPDYVGSLKPMPNTYLQKPIPASPEVAPDMVEPSSTQSKNRMPFLTTVFTKKAKDPKEAKVEKP